MVKKTHEKDIIALALLYRYGCVGSGMISSNALKAYYNYINEYLESNNCDVSYEQIYEENSNLFFTTSDENDNYYVVINPYGDIDKAKTDYISRLPGDILIASQMPNALDAIGLEFSDGVIKQKRNNIKKLVK